MADTINPGKQIRTAVPRTAQGDCSVSPKRPSILTYIRESNRGRIKQLIPIRHGRMSASPFAFYRGTAGIMAHDLSFLPHTKLKVQAIGDCHLMNFGGYATPERTLIFDANDFDETLPAPWEWDVKRLATSFVLAARNNSMREADARDMAIHMTASYRQGIYEFAAMPALDLWYIKFEMHQLMNNTSSEKIRQLLKDAISKAEKATPQQVLYKITRNVRGSYEIADQPPLVYHPIKLEKEKAAIRVFLESYSRSLQADRRFLFSKYHLVDIALKVVGVGSVGTHCMIALMMNEKNEPLLLQVKEARRSVLEDYTAQSRYKHPGERIVQGQRLVQAASDIFLGWSSDLDGKDYYLRQLRDRKITPDVTRFDKEVMMAYAGLCGRALARAHAKTGDAGMISSYLGKSDVMDLAIGKFAVAYADQTEKDFEAFVKAIKAGKLPVEKV
ncbi:MAG TPA: DUF2252 domain-containing protein [Chitinophaga sp.]|uniref:DUF2252 domain-containing protein n=1 Tax=Chitinophaga sp. TaxID=1869181 RepID=UPI002B68C965|nr:DUF2252 domain-containing protein [Chitinophaga sp.]HVI43239.1 DUF2252 domain-containing protein [Chitinophaga sp.]